MPLKKGSSKKTINSNIKELVKSKASKSRAKGIKTIAKKRGISPAAAKRKQALAIAFSEAGKSSKKRNSRKKNRKS